LEQPAISNAAAQTSSAMPPTFGARLTASRGVPACLNAAIEHSEITWTPLPAKHALHIPDIGNFGEAEMTRRMKN